ncbi:MAG TPA: winged helix-turn-helix domain-containing protein [Longimicrobium sp.]|nr:winged helix-turn-helix domain-containing protein [Longimicrobium sp.]
MDDLFSHYRASLVGMEAEEARCLARLEVLRPGIAALRLLIGDAPNSAVHATPSAPADAGSEQAPFVLTPPDEASANGRDDGAMPSTPIATAAETVLRAVGRHMRAREIAKEIVRRGITVETKGGKLRDSVGAIVARRAGDKKLFSKPVKGLYGLLEWNGPGPNETAADLDTARISAGLGPDDDENEAAEALGSAPAA